MADTAELFKKLRETPDELTEAEMNELMTTLSSEEKPEEKKPEEKPPEKARVTLEDGSVLEADSYQELSSLLTAKLGEHRKDERTPEPPAGAPPPKFDMEEFTKRFVKDAREGMEYLETAQYGFPVSKAVPIMAGMVQTLASKVQEIEAQRFLEKHEDYKPSPENQRVLEGIITQRGWRPGYQAFSDAFAVAKEAGLIKAEIGEKPPETKEKPFVPPRTGGKSQATESDLVKAAQDMPLDKLKALLVESGFLGGR